MAAAERLGGLAVDIDLPAARRPEPPATEPIGDAADAAAMTDGRRPRSCSSRTTRPTRHAVATFLRGHGHEVIEAGDAATATAAWERRRPDLIVLDLGLPDEDG